MKSKYNNVDLIVSFLFIGEGEAHPLQNAPTVCTLYLQLISHTFFPGFVLGIQKKIMNKQLIKIK